MSIKLGGPAAGDPGPEAPGGDPLELSPRDVGGAAWFEFWEEDYAVGRAGLAVNRAPGWFALTVEAGTPAGGVWGLAAHGGVVRGRWTFDGALSWGAGVPRQEGVSPLSAWLAVSRPWAPVRRQ